MDTLIPLAQSLSLALLAGWITTGVRDNLVHPALNETFTAEVLTMARLKDAYPEAYERVAHRAITNRAAQRALFRLIVLSELAVTVILWAGVVCLVLSVFGMIGAEFARATALIGALLFASVWGMFIVVGNHFSYWFCHEAAQQTHFQLSLWGMSNVLFIALA